MDGHGIEDVRTTSLRPLVTLALLTYNQQGYVREALAGAFAQTYSPLEIIISDDCSTDATFDVITDEVSKFDGPHQVVVNRNPRNLGVGGNINRVMALAKGELVVGAAGDDVSLPSRIDRLVAYRNRNHRCRSLYSNMMVIDSKGNPERIWQPVGLAPKHLSIEEVIEGRGVFGCTHAWQRDLFVRYGPLDARVVAEDTVIPFRALLAGDVCYVDEVLVHYRRHDANVSKGRSQMTTRSEWLAYTRRYAESTIAVCATMLSDLAKEVAGPMKRSRHVPRWIRMIRRRQVAAELEIKFVSDAAWTARAQVVVAGLLSGVRLRQVGRWVLWHHWSGKYFD